VRICFNHIIKLPSTNNGCFLVKGGPAKGGVGQLGTARTRVVALKENFSFFYKQRRHSDSSFLNNVDKIVEIKFNVFLKVEPEGHPQTCHPGHGEKHRNRTVCLELHFQV
jgi:hypothetical protein